jgi:electron transport complex protein RnfG
MAKKLESTLPNMVLSLTAISLVMSAALSFVYLKTKKPIEDVAKQKEKSAIIEVMPAMQNEPVLESWDFNGVTIYSVKDQENIIGYAVKTFTDKGFSGHIELIAGFLPDGSIYNTEVLQHRETPGLGTKMMEPKFKDQFKGKNPANFKLKVKKDGGEVDAITAATISSRAYCDALQKAYDAIQHTDASTGATN